MTTNLTDHQAPVTDEELDQLIWGLERYGLYPRQLAALKELREVRKAKGEPVAYADPRALSNFEARSATREWMWARSDAGLIPLYSAMLKHQSSNEANDGATCKAEINQPSSNYPATPDSWIPVSERMPEDEQEVLTRNKLGHCFVSFFDKHSGLFFDRLDAPAACCVEHVLVTHWMPLPAAPKEVKSE